MLERLLLWLAAAAALVGAVWLWLNLDFGPDMLLTKLIFVGILWAVWVGIVYGAVAILALFLGMLGFVVKPFRR